MSKRILIISLSVICLLASVGCKPKNNTTEYSVSEYDIADIDGVDVPLGGIPGTDSNTDTEYVYDDINNDSDYECTETEYAPLEYILPEYVYYGDDPVEKAITEYFLSNNYHYEMKASVAIPAFCIFMSEVDENDTDVVKVYGNYWLFVYEKVGTTLECISGVENPGIIYLKKNGDAYVVDHFDQPGEGAKYAEGIKRFSNGNKSLEEQYYNSTDAMKDPVLSKRVWCIKNYVEMFGLNIDSYHDFGWDKVMLSDFEFDGKEE